MKRIIIGLILPHFMALISLAAYKKPINIMVLDADTDVECISAEIAKKDLDESGNLILGLSIWNHYTNEIFLSKSPDYISV